MGVSIRVLTALLTLTIGLGAASAQEPEIWPIYPPHPYRAGHYPKADWYHKMPPYTAISPSFYRKRHFMMSQERNRYRYQPHIFRGQADEYGDDSPVEDVDILGIAKKLRSTYQE